MNQIIATLENGNIITITPKTDQETLLDNFEDYTITQLEITIEDHKETIYKSYTINSYLLNAFDNLLNCATIEDVAKNLKDTHDLNCFNYYPFDEEFFQLFYLNKPYEAARAEHFGKTNWTDKYITLDAYGNLESVYKIPYEDEASEIIQYYLAENT